MLGFTIMWCSVATGRLTIRLKARLCAPMKPRRPSVAPATRMAYVTWLSVRKLWVWASDAHTICFRSATTLVFVLHDRTTRTDATRLLCAL